MYASDKVNYGVVTHTHTRASERCCKTNARIPRTASVVRSCVFNILCCSINISRSSRRASRERPTTSLCRPAEPVTACYIWCVWRTWSSAYHQAPIPPPSALASSLHLWGTFASVCAGYSSLNLELVCAHSLLVRYFFSRSPLSQLRSAAAYT